MFTSGLSESKTRGAPTRPRRRAKRIKVPQRWQGRLRTRYQVQDDSYLIIVTCRGFLTKSFKSKMLVSIVIRLISLACALARWLTEDKAFFIRFNLQFFMFSLCLIPMSGLASYVICSLCFSLPFSLTVKCIKSPFGDALTY